jgi:Na+-transporting NADH:ubiquinone oxidoreductase subunit NqrC
MDSYSLIALVTLVLSLFTLVLLSQLFRNLVRKQIDDQMKDMIPIKSIRDRIGIRIKLRK